MEAMMKFNEVQRHKSQSEHMAREAEKATDPTVKAAYETIASVHLSTFKTLSADFNAYASTCIGLQQNPESK
jgi:hypothetical protein